MPYKSPARPDAKWIVYWPSETPGEPRKYRRFKAKGAAQLFLEQKQIDVLNKGAETAAVHDNALDELKWAVAILKPLGVSIRTAIQSFVDRHAEIAASVPAEEAIRQFLEIKQRDGASARYLGDLRLRLDRFAQSFPGRAVCDITVKDLERWLSGLGVGPVSRNNYRRNVGVLLKWCESMGYLGSNPMRKTSRAKKVAEAVKIFDASELRIILNHAPADLLPALVLGAFAGLRVAEIARLDWREINFRKGHVEVAAEKSKTASRRFVPMEPALRTWLQPLAKAQGGIAPARLNERLSVYRKSLATDETGAGGKVTRPAVPWKANGLRHSYASYAIAREENADRVALWLGHTSAKMTFDAYQERATAEEAEAWFSVYPEGSAAPSKG